MRGVLPRSVPFVWHSNNRDESTGRLVSSSLTSDQETVTTTLSWLSFASTGSMHPLEELSWDKTVYPSAYLAGSGGVHCPYFIGVTTGLSDLLLYNKALFLVSTWRAWRTMLCAFTWRWALTWCLRSWSLGWTDMEKACFCRCLWQFSLNGCRLPEGTLNPALLTRSSYCITEQFSFNIHNFLCCSEKLVFL